MFFKAASKSGFDSKLDLCEAQSARGRGCPRSASLQNSRRSAGSPPPSRSSSRPAPPRPSRGSARDPPGEDRRFLGPHRATPPPTRSAPCAHVPRWQFGGSPDPPARKHVRRAFLGTFTPNSEHVYSSLVDVWHVMSSCYHMGTTQGTPTPLRECIKCTPRTLIFI